MALLISVMPVALGNSNKKALAQNDQSLKNIKFSSPAQDAALFADLSQHMQNP